MTNPSAYDHFDGNPDLVYLIFPDVSNPARPVDTRYVTRKRPINEFTRALSDTEAVSVLSIPGHCAYEFFRGERYVKPYFDYDFHIKKLKDPLRDRVSPEYIEQHRQEFHRIMQRIIDRIREVAGPNVALEYVVAERHGFPPANEDGDTCYKLSFRGFVSGVRMQFSDVKLILNELGEDTTANFDQTVYSKSDNLMAAINGRKSLKDGRMLLPCGDHDLRNYVIQVTEPHWPLIQWPVSTPVQGTREKTAVHSDGDIDDAYIRALIACITPLNRARQYRSWQNLAWAMKDAGRLVGDTDAYFSDFVAISRQVPKYVKVTDHVCRTDAWDKDQAELRGQGSCVTFGSLVFWARADDPEAAQTAYEEYMERKKMRRRDAQIQAVQAAMDERFGQGFAVVTSIDGNLKAHVDFTGENGYVDLASLQVYKGQSFFGMLKQNIRINEPLSGICKEIDPESSFIYNRNTQKLAELQEIRGEAHGMTKIKMFHDLEGTCNAAKVELGSKMVSVTHKNKLGFLKKVCDTAARQTANEIFLINNGTINVFVSEPVPTQTQSDFEIIRDKLLEHAKAHAYRKRNDFIYAPVPNCPCAYVQFRSFKDYINDVLWEDDAYTRNPKRHEELIKFLTNYRTPKLPDLEVDRDLVSFTNGVLQLSTITFAPYTIRPFPLEGKVARHHIDGMWTGSQETPMLDVVLNAQFDTDVADLLCALLGRALFRVKQLDNWQVMLYMVGLGGTGKSLILSAETSLFATGEVATLAPSREAIFGMANLVDQELVVGRDMPAKLSNVLSQECMQMMTSGEGMEIACKREKAINVTAWKSPVVMASNHMPDYVNTGNNVVRRIVPIRFDKVIVNPRDDLEEGIQKELPNVLCRFLHAYAGLREQAKSAGGFWKAVPSIILNWRGDLASATNSLHAFLAKDEEERGFKIEHVEGKYTAISDFKRAYETWARDQEGASPYHTDAAVFASFGFRVIVAQPYPNICRSCKQASHGGKNKCCPDYGTYNRTKVPVICDMVLTPCTNPNFIDND